MRRTLTGFVVVMLAVGVAHAQQKTDWVKQSFEPAKCEAMFPAKPKEMGTQAILEREGGKAALLFQYNLFPKEINTGDKDLVKTVFGKGQDALKNQFKGMKMLSEKRGTLGKNPTLEFDAEIPMLGIWRARWILTPTCFIQVTILGPKDYVDGAEAKKFLESFKQKD